MNLARSYKELGNKDMRIKMVQKVAKSHRRDYQEWAKQELLDAATM